LELPLLREALTQRLSHFQNVDRANHRALFGPLQDTTRECELERIECTAIDEVERRGENRAQAGPQLAVGDALDDEVFQHAVGLSIRRSELGTELLELPSNFLLLMFRQFEEASEQREITSKIKVDYEPQCHAGGACSIQLDPAEQRLL
jgi:hypothetical protein